MFGGFNVAWCGFEISSSAFQKLTSLAIQLHETQTHKWKPKIKIGKITLLLLLLDFELLNPQGPSPPQLLTCFLVIKRFKCHFIMYIPGSWGSLRVTLDKGPGTNLNRIELWIGPFFTLKENTFFYGTMRMSKVPGSNIKKCVIEVWEVWEDYVHLWPPPFFLSPIFHGFKKFCFYLFINFITHNQSSF
jgi:hypothetical protein